MFSFGLLGPLLLQPEGRQVEVTAAKHRTVLALLLARRNTPLSRNRVLGELWPEHVPKSAVENVRTYVSAVRGLLGPYRERLTSRQGSYRLEVQDEELDAALFLNGVNQARSAAQSGDLPFALDRYTAALGLWRGDPLQGVPVGPNLRSYRAVLTESGAQAWEEYYEAQFHSGAPEPAVAGLQQLLADHPTRETAWHKLITILYRSGDRTAALQAYQSARAHLADGLGLDPGPELASLHRKILRGVPAERPARSAPRQLPRPPRLLVGRERELKHIGKVLERPEDSSVIVAIDGLGGVGKSTLAIAAAHAVAEHYPDGQLYVDLQGGGLPGAGPLQPVEVLGRFLRALGALEDRISPDVNEAAAWFRSVTADCRLLLVLDNAASVAQVLPLLPAGKGCAVLVTGRLPLDTLDGVDQVHLSVLPEADAVDLLGALVGLARVSSEPQAAAEIVRLCGLLPLAVRVMGTRLAKTRDPLRQAAERLAQARSRLDELGNGGLDVRSTFDTGYRAILADARSRPACVLLRRLGRWPLAEISTADAAALLGESESIAWRALELLSEHGLIETTNAGFAIHDLVRLFGAELAAKHDSDSEAVAAMTRVVDRYVGIVRRSPLLYLPGDGEPPHLEDDGQVGPVPRDKEEAAAWTAAHVPIISALTRHLAASPGTAALAWRLVFPLTWRLAIHHPTTCLQLYTILVSGPAPDDVHDLARAWCSVSTAHLYLGRFADACRAAESAMALLPRLDEASLVARILCVYGTPLVRTGQPGRALEVIMDAALRYQSLGRLRPVSICLTNAAEAAIYLGRIDLAHSLLQRALVLVRRCFEPHLMSSLLDTLATVQLRLGRSKAVIWFAHAAIRHCETAPNILTHSGALQKRSLAWQALDRADLALADARAAVALCEGSSIPHLHLGALRHLGVILWLGGDPSAAEVLHAADLLAASIQHD